MVLEACEALKQASERWSVPLLRVLRRLVTSAILRPEVEEAWHQGGVASAAGEGEGRLSCLLSRPLSGVIGLLQKQKRRKSTINAAIICCLFPSAAFCVEGNPRLMALHSPGELPYQRPCMLCLCLCQSRSSSSSSSCSSSSSFVCSSGFCFIGSAAAADTYCPSLPPSLYSERIGSDIVCNARLLLSPPAFMF